ncbi:MAG: hypothetical protein KBC47_04420 [Candidatus Peribacteraceae bacterium]|nr:hypothetical protein [Candidatus Peribacteraceae bacterium]
MATYLVTVMNRGTERTQGFSFTHGPTPSGAVFDFVRSSSECIQTGTSVQCTSELEPGEVKTFTIAYTVNNAVSCSLARGLQSVTVQGSTATVSTSVGCVMTNENVSQASSASSPLSSLSSSVFSSSASFSSSEPANDLIDVTGVNVAQQYASGSIVGGQTVIGTVKDDGKGKGKGYKPYPQPRAGAMSDYFLRTTEASLLTPVSEQNTQGGLAMPFMSVLFLSAVFLVIIGFTLFRKKLR